MAEREGFEPPVRLPVLRISSAARSTTLPPLRPSRGTRSKRGRLAALLGRGLLNSRSSRTAQEWRTPPLPKHHAPAPPLRRDGPDPPDPGTSGAPMRSDDELRVGTREAPADTEPNWRPARWKSGDVSRSKSTEVAAHAPRRSPQTSDIGSIRGCDIGFGQCGTWGRRAGRRAVRRRASLRRRGRALVRTRVLLR